MERPESPDDNLENVLAHAVRILASRISQSQNPTMAGEVADLLSRLYYDRDIQGYIHTFGNRGDFFFAASENVINVYDRLNVLIGEPDLLVLLRWLGFKIIFQAGGGTIKRIQNVHAQMPPDPSKIAAFTLTIRGQNYW